MKYIRKFSSIQEMQAAIAADKVGFIGMVHPEGEDPTMNIHVHEIIYPYSLVISCTNNIVTITAEPVGEVTIEYRLNYEGEYVTYTEPFAITETVIVNARAMTKDGSINRNQQCEYVTLPTNLAITCENNTVTITADNATTIEYNFDGSSIYTTYTQPFAITQTVTVYAKASNSGGSITGSQECEYVNPIDYSIPFYIEDVSGSENTVQIRKNNSSAPTLSIQKSTDGTTWETMGTTSATAITAAVPANGKLYLRCSTNAWGTSSYNSYQAISTIGNCNVGGNIMSLLYGSNFTGNETTFPRNSSYNLRGLFNSNTHIVDASDLILPATTLVQSCYYEMFQGCTSLTAAPALPATTLANYCHTYMFDGCTSLTTAPELPATTLAQGCYSFMFQGCTNLNYIKCLATDISASSCTSGWVNGVAATGTFVKNSSMSSWTTGVNGIPTGWLVKNPFGIELTQSLNVATIEMAELDEGTGYYTINGGSHIALSEGTTTIPITQAMNGQTLLVYGEFDGESQQKTLTIKYYNANEIPFYIEDISGSENTIQISKNSSSAPTLSIEKSLDGTTWTSMGTTSTTAITATVPANGKLYLRCSANAWGTSSYYNKINTTGNYNAGGNIMSLLYGSNFTGNETTFPSGSSYNFSYLFYQNTHLISASKLLLPATTLTSYCYNTMFAGCTQLTTTPELPATTLAANCYYYMFSGCYSLTTVPSVLPATTLADYCYQDMFRNCSALTTAPVLPATTLADYCYYQMFTSCSALTTAPVLPATTLKPNCYYRLFYFCSNLNYIKCLATNISAGNCLNDWVSGVAATGTFVKDPSMSSWTTGVNGIPTNWVVQNNSGIALSQDLNVATIEMTELDESTGYYTINGGSQVSIGEGTTTIPITQAMDGQTLLVHGEFDGEPTQETMTLDWVDYSPAITISASNNYVTITTEPNADTIQYRLGSTGEYTNYTSPVYINEDTTIYVTATRTVSGVDYTSTASQAVQHVLIPPTNLVISCTNNFVTITADNAPTLEYNLDGGSTYTTYTVPFFISQSGTVYAKATNSDGSITKSQAVTYVDYRPTITITETNNYVTINAPNANTIQYRLGSTGEYTNYTAPVYIASDTTIYVTATRTVSGVDYTSTDSQEVQHVLIPPTNLTISCASNKVTITAENATTIEYNFDGSSTYTTYTQPFAITQTVTVYAKATNSDGSITASQECEYQSGPDVPFAENLIFYAPLTQGDLTDHISGVNATVPSNITLTWDSTKGMYSIYNPNGGTFWNGLTWNVRLNYSGSFTMFIHVESTSESGNSYFQYFVMLTTNNTDYYAITKARNNASGDKVIVRDNTLSSYKYKFYNNGTQTATTNWSIVGINIPYVMSGAGNNSYCRAYVKDVRIYNRAFSAAEVAQLSQ